MGATMEPKPEPLLTVSETAKRLNVSKSTVRRMINDGTLPTVRVRQRGVRIDASQLEWTFAHWIAESGNVAKPVKP